MKRVVSILLLVWAMWTYPDGAATAQVVATYEVTFLSSWSATTHPQDFPPNPHFSGLIGATHDSTVAFWTAGEPASPGIQNMAETGRKTPLNSEVEAAIVLGRAETVCSMAAASTPRRACGGWCLASARRIRS